MPIFRGNVGNLLQHWVLCEILEALPGHADQLDFVDAYSMAPLADERSKRDGSSNLFDFVQQRLPGLATAYEVAWHALASKADRYPNSAAFLAHIWSSKYSLLLCECDLPTARQLHTWMEEISKRQNCVLAELAVGNWRTRFRRGLPTSGDLTILSFDPYMFDRHGSGRNPGNMDPSDLQLIAGALDSIQSRIIIQLSTYSANNGNSQSDVNKVVTAVLQPCGLHPVGLVRANGNMMSMVFGRNVEDVPQLATLPSRFDQWLSAVKAASDLR